jgi:hypothetical protein
MDLLMSLLFPLVPIAAVWGVIRYGPVRSRWWRREHPVGFALFVGGIAFLAGFVGPMIVTPGANQGPLLGILARGRSVSCSDWCGGWCARRAEGRRSDRRLGPVVALRYE